jgi:hypothetical protein
MTVSLYDIPTIRVWSRPLNRETRLHILAVLEFIVVTVSSQTR